MSKEKKHEPKFSCLWCQKVEISIEWGQKAAKTNTHHEKLEHTFDQIKWYFETWDFLSINVVMRQNGIICDSKEISTFFSIVKQYTILFLKLGGNELKVVHH